MPGDKLQILKDYYSLTEGERSKLDPSKYPVLRDFQKLPGEEQDKVFIQLGLKKKEPTSEDSGLPLQTGGQEQELSPTGSSQSSNVKVYDENTGNEFSDNLSKSLNEILLSKTENLPLSDQDNVLSNFKESINSGTKSQEQVVSEYFTRKIKEDTELSDLQTSLQDQVGRGSISAEDAQKQFMSATTDKYRNTYQKELERAQMVDKQAERERDPIVSFGTTLWNTLTKQIPKGYIDSMASSESDVIQDSLESLKKLEGRGDSEKVDWMREAVPGVGNTVGEHKEYYKKKLENTIPQLVESLDISKKFEEALADENVVNTLKEIEDPWDIVNYTFSSVAQSLGQIPASTVTLGLSTYIQEQGDSYMSAVNDIAKDRGITPQEVIEQGLDKDSKIASGAIGAINQVLDLVGVSKVTGAFSKNALKKGIINKLSPGISEFVTESGQAVISDVGTDIGLQNVIKDREISPEWGNVLEEGVAAFIGGQAVGSMFHQSKQPSQEEVINDRIKEIGINSIVDPKIQKTKSGQTQVIIDPEEKATPDQIKELTKDGDEVIEQAQPNEIIEEYKVQEDGSIGVPITNIHLNTPIDLIQKNEIEGIFEKNGIDISFNPEGDAVTVLRDDSLIGKGHDVILEKTIEQDEAIRKSINEAAEQLGIDKSSIEVAGYAAKGWFQGVQSTKAEEQVDSTTQEEVSQPKEETPLPEQPEVTEPVTEQPVQETPPVQETRTEENREQKESISDEEFNTFVDKGTVSEDTLTSIADKVKNRKTLTERENQIFTSKTADINKIISEKPEGKLSGLSSDTDKKSPKSYLTRASKTPKYQEAVKNDNLQGTQKSEKLAQEEVDKVFKGKEKDASFLEEVWDEIKSDKEIDPMIRSKAAQKLHLLHVLNGNKDNANEVINWVQDESRKGGQFIRALRSDGSPESLVSRTIAGLQNKKQEILGKVNNEGVTNKEVIQELYDKISKLESEIEKIKSKSGKQSFNKKENLQKRNDAKRRIAEKLERLVTKKAVDDTNPFEKDTSLLQDVIDLFDTYLVELAGKVDVAISSVMSSLKSMGIDPKYLDKKILTDRAEEILPVIKEELTALKKKALQKAFPKGLDKKTVKHILENDVSEMTIEEFEDAFGDTLGFETMTPEQTEKFLEMAGKVQELEGELQNRMLLKLQDYLIEIGVEKETVFEKIHEIWYTNALSSPQTSSRAAKGMINTSIIRGMAAVLTSPVGSIKAIPAAIKGLINGRGTFIQIIRDGLHHFDFIDVHPKKGSGYINRVINTPMKDLIENKKFKRAAIKAFLYAPAKIYRTLIAVDALAKQGLYPFYSTLEQYNSILDNGGSIKEALNKTGKFLAEQNEKSLDESIKREKEIAKELGIKLNGYEQRRKNEVLQNQLTPESLERVQRNVSKSLIMEDPEGILGSMYRVINSNLSVKDSDGLIKKISKTLGRLTFVPFLRIGSNAINANIDYTPLGIYRAIRGTYKNTRGTHKMSFFDRQLQLTQASMGLTISSFIFAHLFDYDDEKEELTLNENRLIDIVGPGTNDYYKNRTIGRNYKDWSIRFRLSPDDEFGDYYTFKDSPIGMMLAPIAITSDEIKLNKKDADKAIQFTYGTILMSQILYAGEQTYMQSVSDTKSLFAGAISGDLNRLEYSANRIFSRPSQGFVFPNLYKELNNQYKAFNDIGEKRSKTLTDRLIKGIPVVEDIIDQNSYDIFGYQIRKDFNFAFVPDVVLSTAKNHLAYVDDKKEWKLLHKYDNVTVGNFKPPRSYRNEKINIDDPRNESFNKEVGLEFRRLVDKYYDKLNKMEPEELQDYLNVLRDKAREGTVRKIYRKK